MSSSHPIDPRSFDDSRNVYRSVEEFYASDRPEYTDLPEDRPRGGEPGTFSLRHRGTWGTVALVTCIILLVLVGIALFP
ncbi:hypothetical protein RKE30_24250 [Streptomyces sp. Li-HN-5-11]|uniref:hypothetical protein n=1 Tax=Streptomyces sp. Li-HN-5-11 TaxID=3075432 RepID=UPI0028A7E324|nr:hypothetical protein [Streptomyces sp. Li-HN-5-11]WNM33274.1 hypothetical protein RKE30_24250 [Streptomyces sp. Li-HN-5-11]